MPPVEHGRGFNNNASLCHQQFTAILNAHLAGTQKSVNLDRAGPDINGAFGNQYAKWRNGECGVRVGECQCVNFKEIAILDARHAGQIERHLVKRCGERSGRYGKRAAEILRDCAICPVAGIGPAAITA